MIRLALPSDAEAIVGIYNHYVANTTITFEELPVSVDDMAGRITDIQAAGLPWLVLEESGQLLGYAYASKWKTRSAYRYSVEISVYLQQGIQARGLGSRLYEALFDALVERDIHAAMGGIVLPNEASVRLHEKFGMKQVARFEQVGYKFGRWLDVGYWQKVF
ncbi:arsinothricin resistance N-acetyltransferase ArsN1 family B [Hylemonella gracilis]|uniref:Phosphinothricin acetyltransferase n=1 Tax=Hylemonella gracilis ATCC 19624 TaxID=887062 RepID=F3KNL1_9BURK|nr:arsinothricin resistance N-acetyltransferase ArsN1 family B [Hylemonella gracilis]EGI78577.1 Phosphinothricin acetyltransferase [Hylemonella gracilis ATCC 19624]